MKALSKISKIFLFLFVSTGAVWLGSYITRLSLFYNLFQANEFVLKEFVSEQNMVEIFKTLTASITINLIFYLLMLSTFLTFIISSKLSLKQNGWLFISMILILLTAPFELYLCVIDYKILSQVLSADFAANDTLKLIIERFTIFSSFPIVEILSYFAVAYFFLFQPLSGSRKRLSD